MKIIKKIIVPVNFDSAHLSVAIQAAEIAKEHKAEIYLIHVCKPTFTNLFSQFSISKGTNSIYRLTKSKNSLICSWKLWIEKEYGIKVNTIIEWGSKGKIIIDYAREYQADLIALKKQKNITWFNKFKTSASEYIIAKSSCQVITFLTEVSSISKWQNIVIPVTNFIPEVRVKTIVDIVKSFNVKLHLLAFSKNSVVDHKSNFYYLSETLKMLKASGNVQVECKCISSTKSQIQTVVNYAKKVNADAIITNNKIGYSTPLSFGKRVKNYFKRLSSHQNNSELFPV